MEGFVASIFTKAGLAALLITSGVSLAIYTGVFDHNGCPCLQVDAVRLIEAFPSPCYCPCPRTQMVYSSSFSRPSLQYLLDVLRRLSIQEAFSISVIWTRMFLSKLRDITCLTWHVCRLPKSPFDFNEEPETSDLDGSQAGDKVSPFALARDSLNSVSGQSFTSESNVDVSERGAKLGARRKSFFARRKAKKPSGTGQTPLGYAPCSLQAHL